MASRAEGYTAAGKDAAAREREERLNSARKKLKTYRSRASAPTHESPAASPGPSSATKRASLVETPSTGASHRHKKSLSRSAPGAHGRRASKSRSVGLPSPLPLSSPGAVMGTRPTSTASRNPRVHEDDLPIPFMDFSSGSGRQHDFSMAGWQMGGLSPGPSATSGDAPPMRSRRTSSIYGSAASFFQTDLHASMVASLPVSIAVSSPAPSATSALVTGPPISGHARRPSRHNRQSSVSNFRESIEIMSGAGVYTGGLAPAVVSSFAGTGGSSPPQPFPSPRGSPAAVWSNDPVKMLETLKERGRLESAAEQDPTRTRQGALEALEGRLAAPSELIDLGNLASGQLLVAPPSPGFTALSPTPSAAQQQQQPPSSPMPIGLGLSNAKRNSWGTIVPAAGAKGASELSMLVEEDEYELEDDEDILPGSPASTLSKSRRRPGSLRRRPSSLTLASPVSNSTIALNDEPTPVVPAFATRPLRLSTASTASRDDSPATTPTAKRTTPLKPLTLSTTPGSSPTLSRSSPEERRQSSFFPATLASFPASTLALARPPSFDRGATPPIVNRSLRTYSSNSFASEAAAAPAPFAAPSPLTRSPIQSRRSSANISTLSPVSKRSSITYLTHPSPSLASAQGPLSPSAQAARRPWRVSTSSEAPVLPPPSYATFPLVPSHGALGGFGDLVDDGLASKPPSIRIPGGRPAPLSSSGRSTTSWDSLLPSTSTVTDQLGSLRLSTSSASSSIRPDNTLRMRVEELELEMQSVQAARRFEVAGLVQRLEQAQEALADMKDERDSLAEDVDGWRSRCAQLETSTVQARDGSVLAQAQAKLSTEMRDQIYTLVAALEREQAEHARTRQQLEQISSERPDDDYEDEPGLALARRHTLDTSRSSSALSTSSLGAYRSGSTTETSTSYPDLEDKYASPPPRGLFHSTIGSRDRDSDFISTLPPSGLDTLTEEDEDQLVVDEEDRVTEGEVNLMIDQVNEASIAHDEVQGMAMLDEAESESDRIRLGSGSTDTTDTSEVMPTTPVKEMGLHTRSDSFVRHWSFPKGSIPPVRISDQDHSFFDLGRHTSLPALPIASSLLPPFLCADLTVDDDHPFELPIEPSATRPEPRHASRPLSPAPVNPIRPHSRRLSSQFKAPPISPSALARAALQSSTSSMASMGESVAPSAFASLSRLSFGNIGNLLSYVSPSSSYSPTQAKREPTPLSQSQSSARTDLHISSQYESDRAAADDYSQALFNTTPTKPPPMLHTRPAGKAIDPASVRPPRASALAKLNFEPCCCEEERVYNV